MGEYVHYSVLLKESLEVLRQEGPGILVDCTLGEGGHSEAFLLAFPELRVIGVDADADIQAIAIKRLSPFKKRFTPVHAHFDDFLGDYPSDLPRPTRVLMDLGISSFHYSKSGRGFSFRADEALDMRLDSSVGRTAADIVNSEREDALANIIFNFGEERYSRRIARAIIEARSRSNITRANELADIVYKAVPADYRHGAIHPATRSFQALRIAVNSELERLPRALESAIGLLEPKGRIGVISFHSLEDRIVKRAFIEKNKSCTCPPEEPICKCGGKRIVDILTRKPIVPSEDEIAKNPPSRSAKLRAAEKIAWEGAA